MAVTSMSIWDELDLEKLEKRRDKLRNSGRRLAFDCFNLKCRGDRAFCSKDKPVGWAIDGSISVLSILRGETPFTCRNCIRNRAGYFDGTLDRDN